MKLSILFLLLVLGVSCSSRFSKNYEVVDGSHEDIPEWIEDTKEWAEDEDEEDYKKHRYYVYTTEGRADKEMVCKSAVVKGRAEIAAEITAFIKDSFSESVEGDPRSQKNMERYLESNLAQEVQAFVVGARKFRSYWEKRQVKKDLGAKKDDVIYSCSALLKISKKQIQKAFDRAAKKLEKKASKKDLKLKVKESMQSAQEAYLKVN